MTKEELEKLKQKIHKSETILNGKISCNRDKQSLLQYLFKIENQYEEVDGKFTLDFDERSLFGHDFPRTYVDKDVVIIIIKRRIDQLDESIAKLDQEFKDL